MKRGFMDLAAEIVKKYPGLTSLEVAREALASDSNLSDAKKIPPEQSLATTLAKQVRTGNEKRIMRERVGGVYCYFPAVMPSASYSREAIVVQLSLSTEELEDIDNLIAVSEFDNRSNAIKWLVTEGIKAKRAHLDRVANTKNQIERLKRELKE